MSAGQKREKYMSRPKMVTAAAVVHTADTLLVLALAIACFILTRSNSVRSLRESAEAIRGLIIGGSILAAVAVVYAVGASGLWRSRRWGWWVSFLTNAAFVLAVLADIFVDHDRDPDNWIAAAIFARPVVLLCLPGVRKFFRRPPPVEVTTAA